VQLIGSGLEAIVFGTFAIFSNDLAIDLGTANT